MPTADKIFVDRIIGESISQASGLRMVLDADNGDLLRVEGKLSKNPSFWTSLVNVIRHFAKLDGVRVPVSTESVAKVKFAGESRLDVFYQYESINGRPVSVAARQMLASAGVADR